MKPALTSWLRCPDCGNGDLKLEAFTFDRHAGVGDSPEILEGYLACRCGAWFPIIKGVPRLLPRHLRAALHDDYPAFFSEQGPRLPVGADVRAGGHAPEVRGQRHVMESFGFEWTEFADYKNENFDDWVAPVRPDFFKGKLGVDAGCGAGRHAMKAHEYGAEIVAMDLSAAVDAAYLKARTTTRMHVVQGDIFNPPLARETFDFVYSLGVLHHTPDPPRAFQSLAPLLRAGGTMAVMVYASGRPMALGVLATIRAVTIRLPLPVTKILSWLAATVDTVGPIALYRGLLKLGAPREHLDALTPEHIRLYARESFGTCYTDWLDRLSYPYVHYYTRSHLWDWFIAGGLEKVTVRPLGVHGWTGVGNARTRRPQPSENGVVKGSTLCAG
jgi:SAM-dependent methyltransferase/uncharacterized protein YbaR (Trm112 family)